MTERKSKLKAERETANKLVLDLQLKLDGTNGLWMKAVAEAEVSRSAMERAKTDVAAACEQLRKETLRADRETTVGVEARVSMLAANTRRVNAEAAATDALEAAGVAEANEDAERARRIADRATAVAVSANVEKESDALRARVLQAEARQQAEQESGDRTYATNVSLKAELDAERQDNDKVRRENDTLKLDCSANAGTLDLLRRDMQAKQQELAIEKAETEKVRQALQQVLHVKSLADAAAAAAAASEARHRRFAQEAEKVVNMRVRANSTFLNAVARSAAATEAAAASTRAIITARQQSL
jgi:hypothetical protein